MKKAILPALMILILFSCADEEKKKEIEILEFKQETVENSYKDCDPENGDCTFISLSYPVAKNTGKISKRINLEVESFLQNTVDFTESDSIQSPRKLVDQFLQNYERTATDFPDYELPWGATILGKVIQQNEELVSMEFTTDMFTGGAHGYNSVSYLNFDAETGKLLVVEDLFSSEFTKKAEQDFRVKQNIPEGASINNTGFFFENEKFHLPANIGIYPGKIVLHYNAYEIAPYSAGSFRMTYSRAEILEYLKINEPVVE